MTITYANGQTVEAALVARIENRIRVAFQGGDDVVEFTDVNGTWVSEECEPVQIEFHWSRRTRPVNYTEDDFVCSHDLASKLIHLLLNPEEPADPKLTPFNLAQCPTASALVF